VDELVFDSVVSEPYVIAEYDDIDTIIEKLYVARYYYSRGIEYMSDREYNLALEKVKQAYPDHDLVVRTWSTDLVPHTLLEKYNLPLIEGKSTVANCALDTELVSRLKIAYKDMIENRYSTEVSKSIELVRDYDTIFKFLNQFVGCRMHLSFKEDGYHWIASYIKPAGYQKAYLVDVTTRARGGDGLDITAPMSYILPHEVDSDEEFIRLAGEVVLPKQHLPYLREKYGTNNGTRFNVARNSVSTMLRGGVDTSDLSLLVPFVFKVRSEKLNSLTEEFAWAQQRGFNTPHSFTFIWDGNREYFTSLVHYLGAMRNKLECDTDGLVLAVDDNNLFYSLGSSAKAYNGNIACKVGVWDASAYTSNLEGILWSYNSQYITPVGLIDPTVTDTGATVTNVPLGHVARMIDLWTIIGGDISFNYVGGTCVELVY
jgi:hypothetical protein